MNHVPCLSVASLLAVAMLLTVPGASVAGWRVIPTSGFVTDDLDLDIRNHIGDLQISTQMVGDHIIHQTLLTVEGDVIDAISVCAFTDSPSTFIRSIVLLEFVFPGSVGLRHVDDTHVPRTISETGPGREIEPCYVSPVANYAPAGAVTLVLPLHFGSSSTRIQIGAVAVHTK